VPKRKKLDDYDYAETVVMTHDATPSELADPRARASSEAHANDDEYLRVLADLPVLRDVVREPPPVVVRDFRLGERRDARKHAREDALTLREQHACDLEQQYCEYVAAEVKQAGAAARGGARKSSAKKPGSKPSKRSKRSKRRRG
jgi:hypothetical protein